MPLFFQPHPQMDSGFRRNDGSGEFRAGRIFSTPPSRPGFPEEGKPSFSGPWIADRTRSIRIAVSTFSPPPVAGNNFSRAEFSPIRPETRTRQLRGNAPLGGFRTDPSIRPCGPVWDEGSGHLPGMRAVGAVREPPLRVNAVLFVIPAHAGMTADNPDCRGFSTAPSQSRLTFGGYSG